jgi:hypothetical protein
MFHVKQLSSQRTAVALVLELGGDFVGRMPGGRPSVQV